MPITDFKCNSCGKDFVILKPADLNDDEIKCIYCKETNCSRLEPLMAYSMCDLRGSG